MPGIKERILEILERENLSQVAFSDRSGINKSTLSHVLTGRNQPSHEVISKVLNAFPRYRREWLIAGDEPMIDENTPENTPSSTDGFEKSTHEQSDWSANAPKTTSHADLFSFSNNSAFQQINGSTPASDLLPITDRPTHRSVVKIIVYYDDYTFQTFYPEKEEKK